MPDDVILSLRRSVTVTWAGAALTLDSPSARITLADLSPGLQQAWRVLVSEGASEDALLTSAGAPEDAIAAALMRGYLRRCDELALLQYSAASGNRRLMTIEPMVEGFHFSENSLDPDARVRLSRFAGVRREDEDLVLESPLATSRAILDDGTGVAIVALLASPASCQDLCARLGGSAAPEPGAIRSCVSLLTAAGFLGLVDSDGRLAEDDDPALMPWEFHDLLFHARSRRGRHDYPSGKVFPFGDRLEPLPAVAPARSTEVVPLRAPDPIDPAWRQHAFGDVLERRRSVREYGAQPMTAAELGEFLFRSARVTEIHPPFPDRPYEASRRPYPSGGAAYDLDVYITVRACDGLAPGFYHYHPVAHQLERLPAPAECVDQLLRDAQGSAGLEAPPPILITLSSRFRRVSWKYRGMSYATTLKNAGVLLQTMYLVATAMGLAPCALGGGNSRTFAKAAGTGEFEESSVGEFILGSRAES